ncbi:BC1881 family protein [Anaeromassilibacillus senegalensis]|uniref:BC1881 family protein n=1 Tax=Anaeromassilibacillus senegalensis TaxID=1673717 RepID=A0ABS9CMH7_9FIRM|nr:BC1881 family protein [Anaeromassilibacillus senegalensis]MCF2651818.1 BC1881 family protein [Anaeromassilibacillus senegalensis]MCI5651043.1 BC1881 family protein [Ruminococcus bromii]
MNLENIPTCELVDELSKRDGVVQKIAEPYQDVDISVNGPAIILVVTD